MKELRLRFATAAWTEGGTAMGSVTPLGWIEQLE
jgi:hypothetical protein